MTDLIIFPFERVVQINTDILATQKGLKGTIDINKLRGALSRIESAIHYDGLKDIFDIAAKYANSIAVSHAMPDANKRTALAVALEYLSLNDLDILSDNQLLANAVRDLVLNEISEKDYSDILYSQYIQDNSNK